MTKQLLRIIGLLILLLALSSCIKPDATLINLTNIDIEVMEHKDAKGNYITWLRDQDKASGDYLAIKTISGGFDDIYRVGTRYYIQVKVKEEEGEFSYIWTGKEWQPAQKIQNK